MTAEDLALLATTATEFEAQMKAAVLRDQGIEARVLPAPPGAVHPGPLVPAPAAASVWVKRDDLGRARALLERTIRESGEIEWETSDVGAREDQLPLHAPGRMPLLVRAGLAVAVAAILLAAIWVLVVLLPIRW